MTTKRDSKGKPKSAKRPKIKKETLKDLGARDGEQVKAGAGTSRANEHCSL